MDESNINQTFAVVNLAQRSPEWYAFRRGKIGASQVAAIMGLSPFQTKLQVWEEMVLGTQKEMNENMERGIRLEAEALSLANASFEKNGHAPFIPIVAQSKNYPDLICSLDGWNGTEILEIKCPRKFSQSIPDYYNAQIQHQLFIMNAQNAWYMEYVNGEVFYQLVSRDEEFIREMLSAELSFLSSMIDFRPPEPTDRDWVIENHPNLVEKAFRYKELSLLIEELETERKELRNDLIEWAPHSRTRCGDLNLTKVISKGRIGYEKLLADHPEIDAEKYRNDPQTSWRITRASSS